MKIAQVAPLYEAVPPKFYGGTERIVSFLTEALVELGHQVTLFPAPMRRAAPKSCPSATALAGKTNLRMSVDTAQVVASAFWQAKLAFTDRH
jgi:hypothetical protein